MRHTSSLIVLVICAAAYIFFSPLKMMAQTQQISGQVLDKNNKGVPKIKIAVKSGLVGVASGETDSRGNYSIPYQASGPITVLYIGNTEFLPRIEENLVGTINLNVILDKRGEKLNKSSAKNVIEALEYLDELSEFREESLEYAKAINPSDFPKEFQEKVFQRNILARLDDAEKRATAVAALSERLGQVEQNNQSLSGQIDELAAVSNAAKGGAKAAQETADAAVAGVNATNDRISALDDYVIQLSAIVIFNTSSSNLTPQALKQLDEIALKVAKLRGYRIEISGFADAGGSSQRGVLLSQQRAETVARYLTGNHEIPLLRILPPTGYGEARAIDNKALDEKQRNKNRVEVKVLVNRGINQGSPTMQVPPTNSEP